MVGDFFTDMGRLKEKQELEERWGIQINWAEYFRLRGALVRIQRRYRFDWTSSVVGRSLETFIASKGKGCGRYRRVLRGKWSRGYMENDPRAITENVMGGVRVEWENRVICEMNFKLWTLSYLQAEFKNFCFRLVQGRLYLNQQRARFAEVGRWCTFCGIIKTRELGERGIVRDNVLYNEELMRLPGENPEHLFWECGTVNRLVNSFFNNIAGTQNREVDKKKYFTGWCGKSMDNTVLILVSVHMVKYVLYKYKIRQRIPTFFTLGEEFRGMMEGLFRFGRWREKLMEIQETLRGIMVENV